MGTMAPPTESLAQVSHWPPRATGEWTVDMLGDLPDDGRRYEILDGVLLVTPSPAPRHQLAAAQLFRLFDHACPPDHRAFFAPLDWQPDDRTSLVPDLLVVSRAAYRETGALDSIVVAVEIASPSTARIDRTAKRDRYEEGGIKQYWLVDPGIRSGGIPTVVVYDLADGAYREAARAVGDETVRVALPIPAAAEMTLRPTDLIAW